MIRGKSKLLLAILAVVCLGVTLAAGQGQAPPAKSTPAQQPTGPLAVGGSATGTGTHRTLESQAEMRLMIQQLNLTPEQREKLRPIVTEQGQQLNNLRLDEHMPPDQKRAKVQEIRDSYRPKIMAVLTPQQQEKWKKVQEARRERQPKIGDTESTAPQPQESTPPKPQ